MLPLRDDVPTRIAPTVTIVLVALNVAAFLYELSLQGPRSHGAAEKFIESFAVVPRALLAPRPHLRTWITPLTSMFLHAGFLHVAGHMLYLRIFGNNNEHLLAHAPRRSSMLFPKIQR